VGDVSKTSALWARDGDEASQILLHAGCGHHRKSDLIGAFRTVAWREVRYDIDPDAQPDILGSLTDMEAVPTAAVDAVFNSHVIEHLYPHEVPLALREFHRVLKPDGFVVLTCPDLQSVAEAIARGRLMDVIFHRDYGPVTPFDMLYGDRAALAMGKMFMAHHGGFTAETVMAVLTEAGFATTLAARTDAMMLWAIATKSRVDEEELDWFRRNYLPNGERRP
jgi:SAM-dependent methyltransferase